MKKVYIAGPLFTKAERDFLEEIEKLIKELGFETYLPHKDAGVFIRGKSSSEEFFKKDLDAMKNCDILVTVLNGNEVDSGTAWEIGFAYSKRIKIIGILDDTRKPDNELLNPMIVNSIKIVNSVEELKRVLQEME
jgi:nucleoside 2-deoxyribosyltransferase